MTDPDHDPAVTDDASALAASVSGGDAGGGGGAEAAEAAMSGSEGGSGSSGLITALFETEPDMSPSSVKAPPPVAEAVVGLRKFLSGLGVDTGDGGDGTPAVIHFVRAAVGLGQLRAGGDGDPDDAEPQSPPPSEGADRGPRQ